MIEEGDEFLALPKVVHEKSPSVMPAELSARDVEKGRFAFSIYDFDGNETMDAYYVADCLRALNFNPTNKEIEKWGGTSMKKQRILRFEEFLPIFAKAKNSKSSGPHKEDFEECLKLYDKHDDGKILFVELQHILQAVGEPLTKNEVDYICKECCEEEDEDGFVRYAPFLEKLLKP